MMACSPLLQGFVEGGEALRRQDALFLRLPQGFFFTYVHKLNIGQRLIVDPVRQGENRQKVVLGSVPGLEIGSG